jgi:hypothetical protein
MIKRGGHYTKEFLLPASFFLPLSGALQKIYIEEQIKKPDVWPNEL